MYDSIKFDMCKRYFVVLSTYVIHLAYVHNTKIKVIYKISDQAKLRSSKLNFVKINHYYHYMFVVQNYWTTNALWNPPHDDNIRVYTLYIFQFAGKYDLIWVFSIENIDKTAKCIPIYDWFFDFLKTKRQKQLC